MNIEPSSKHKYAYGANDVRSDAEGRFQIQHLLTDEPFALHAYRDGYAARQFFALAPGVNDYRITLPREASLPPAVDYNKRLEDGKRLIGRAAPPWEVAEWVQKLDRSPVTRMAYGRQSIYVLDELGVVRGVTSKMEEVEQLIGKK